MDCMDYNPYNSSQSKDLIHYNCNHPEIFPIDDNPLQQLLSDTQFSNFTQSLAILKTRPESNTLTGDDAALTISCWSMRQITYTAFLLWGLGIWVIDCHISCLLLSLMYRHPIIILVLLIISVGTVVAIEHVKPIRQCGCNHWLILLVQIWQRTLCSSCTSVIRLNFWAGYSPSSSIAAHFAAACLVAACSAAASSVVACSAAAAVCSAASLSMASSSSCQVSWALAIASTPPAGVPRCCNGRPILWLNICLW